MKHPAPQHDLALLLNRIERRLVERQRAILEPAGCSVAEWRVVHLLSSGPRTMREIADYIVMAAPTLTKMVDRLVANNLVHRRVDVEDRRRVRIFLTPRGKSVHQRLNDQLRSDQAQMLCATEDADRLSALLDQLDRALDGDLPGAVQRQPAPGH